MGASSRVSRRAALKALGAGAGAAALVPWLSDDGLLAYSRIQASQAPPSLHVLTPGQYATVEALVESIIPADDRSPGAREARVADYIDLLLSEADEAMKEPWLGGIAALDEAATTRFGGGFSALTPAQMEALLTDISRNEKVEKQTPLESFFVMAKTATIHGYYTSEIGIQQDLRYKGNRAIAEFVGCETVDGKDCPHCGQKAQN